MKEKDFTGIIPAQYTGEEIEVTASVEFIDQNQAKFFFDIAKSRLLNVNNWHHLAGIISAKFQLMNAWVEEAGRKAEKGDYFKIDIPGPGSNEGDGYDWVCVEEIKEIDEEDIQSLGIRVRPVKNPLGDKEEIAHFYSSEATSNFIITREKNKITAWIIDRNIKPNDDAASLTDKIRDVAVGLGAIGLFSKVQWQGLANGLVKKEN